MTTQDTVKAVFQRPEHEPTTHIVPPSVVAKLNDATTRRDSDARAHVLSAWAESILGDEQSKASCDICKTHPAWGASMDVMYVTGDLPGNVSWMVTYVYVCSRQECHQDAHTMQLRLRKAREAEQPADRVQQGCFTCLATEDLLLHVPSGAFYCPVHRPRPAKPTCNVCASTRDARKCPGCATVFYCSQECQSCDWAAHKPDCRAIAKARALLKTDE
jgi:hypothetical protein